MPPAEKILADLQMVFDEGRMFAVLVRLLLAGFVSYSVAKRRLYPALLAAYAGLVLVAAALMAIALREHGNLLSFALLFALGLLWGREALLMPPSARPSRLYVIAGGALALAAFFYPHFSEKAWEVIVFAPLGVLPCPTLILTLAAVIAGRRIFSLYTVIPTWVVAAFYGVVGVFYLGVAFDWVLLLAVPVSAGLYFLAPQEEERRRSKRFKRRR